ncbi:EpsG family protein [Tenacibaculum finnmarkense]|uniref:EpsG family protein n=2 Tax=Tenacibaculum finnmarkense TaxID=2781243 RepID=UPI001E52D3DC|nr:EpsG family protein [Tenacibaculum finnmarkense]MCD8447603.1 EpsG family protein [Tenacibaculum finnmarkense genomovar finnmarkense]
MNILGGYHYRALSKKKMSWEYVMIFILFLLSPIVSFPFIIILLYTKGKESLFLISLFLGVVSYMLLPSWELDLSRYYLYYEQILKYDLSSFLEFLKQKNDYVFYSILFMFSRLGLKYQLVLLIISTFNFYISLKIFDRVYSRYSTKEFSQNKYFLLCSLFILSLPVMSLISVSRFSIGYTFFMLGVYRFIVNNKIRGVLNVFIASITHFAFIVYLPFFPLLLVKNKKRVLALILIIFMFSFFVPIEKVIVLLSNYIPFLSTKMLIYLELFADTNIKILSTILLGPVFISIMFLIFYYKIIPQKLYLFCVMLLLVVLLTIPLNLIIYDRFVQVFKPVLALTVVVVYLGIKNKKNIYILESIIVLLLFFFSLYYVYTFGIIYRENLKIFLNIFKLLFVSILNTTYSLSDFL